MNGLTPAEILADICSLVPEPDRLYMRLHVRLAVHYLADNILEACCDDGTPLRHGDPSDFVQFFRDLRQALNARPASANSLCPDCRHTHEGREQCDFYLGEEKFCRCPSKVAV